MQNNIIPTGIYEQVINQLFAEKLKSFDEKDFFIGKRVIKSKDAADYLSRYLYNLVSELFHSFDRSDNGISICSGIVNDVIKQLGREFNIEDYADNLLDAELTILTAIVDKTKCDYPDIAEYIKSITPTTSLTHSHLFTGHNDGVNMSSELRREIHSADDICILVSFIRTSGLNEIESELRRYTREGKRLRIITTTYMKATEFKAIKRLSGLPNTEIKISYNCDRDRLHAKSYLFLRKTGFHTAYIGSSNISGVALTHGLEWNLKITQAELPNIIATVRNSFETYWADETFETFHSNIDDERLRSALSKEDAADVSIEYSVLDLINAHEYQNEILEKLKVERNLHNHYRNLIVAATGTGKTVIAAFDFKHYLEKNPNATFLFVVHREEIIKQACATFRTVLGDPNFGDMWYGDVTPNSYRCLFASKDMLNRRLGSLSLAQDYYDYIIFDEAHHIVADSYQKIFQRFTPKVLLGLTATPERMDGVDITEYFDGHISAEIRLATALNNGLLAPFHYYGISDDTDLSQIGWERGRFVASELSNVYTHNDKRTSTIFNSLEKYLPDVNNVSALCFCVDQKHASYMNAKFTLANLKSAVLTSENGYDRVRLLRQLREKKINYLFVVDMFNEGVDVPNIDTVLFLRPTESCTIFLQQLGRGLRKAKGKDHLTVLDYVGHSRAEFNYVDRFRQLMGRTSMSVKEEIEHNFPHMPLGCQIVLEEKAREEILHNINAFIKSFTKNKIIFSVSNFQRDFDMPLTLANFMKMTHVTLDKIYKISTWNNILGLAGKECYQSKFTKELSRAVYKKWLSVDSFSYFSFIYSLAVDGFKKKENELSIKERKMALMFYYDMFQEASVYSSLQNMFDDLCHDNGLINELLEVMPILQEQCEANEREDNSPFALIMPFKLHGIYTKDQINVAIEKSQIDYHESPRDGVKRNKNLHLEAMFIDIIKNREEGSSTNYNDFAKSRDFFNWETPNSVAPHTPAGKDYINKANTMLLFVRKQADHPDDKSRAMGYAYLGEVELVEWSGAKPMQILWRLKNKMPSSVFSYAAKFKAIG